MFDPSIPVDPALLSLRSRLKGTVILPGDGDYDTARSVFYTGFDRRPAAVVRVADADDVAEVVSLARESGMELAVRSGGHSVAGYGVSEGGLVLDLGGMKGLHIDPERRTAWAETGLTTGAYTAAAAEHGLATGFGDAPSVGVGGITLGGGVGFLHRRYGLTVDSLLAADVVTADGRLLRVDDESHPDLFWAIRGGGGNFGVATRLQFRLHEVDTVVGGMLILPATPEVVAGFLAEAEAAPEELSGMINVAPAPPLPFVPAELHGRPIVMAVLVHTGAAEAGARAFAPFRALATPLVDDVQQRRYVELFEGGEAPHPVHMAVHPFFLDSFDRADAERVLDGLAASSAPMRVAQFRVLGGAVARVPADRTAFAHRHRRIMGVAAAAFPHPEETAEHASWASSLATDLSRSEPGAYIGFLGQGTGRAREAYPGATWERLREVKARYDPTNVFRLNLNVPPAE